MYPCVYCLWRKDDTFDITFGRQDKLLIDVLKAEIYIFKRIANHILFILLNMNCAILTCISKRYCPDVLYIYIYMKYILVLSMALLHLLLTILRLVYGSIDTFPIRTGEMEYVLTGQEPRIITSTEWRQWKLVTNQLCTRIKFSRLNSFLRVFL